MRYFAFDVARRWNRLGFHGNFIYYKIIVSIFRRLINITGLPIERPEELALLSCYDNWQRLLSWQTTMIINTFGNVNWEIRIFIVPL